MSQICPLCQNVTNELIPIPDPGQQYQYCCSRCEIVARLITEDYPYRQSWYDQRFPMFALLFPPSTFLFTLQNGIATGEDAKRILKEIRDFLAARLASLLSNYAAVELVTWLARLFADVTHAMHDPNLLTQILSAAQKMGVKKSQGVTASEMLAQLDILRVRVLYLQEMSILAGSSRLQSLPLSPALMSEMVTLSYQIDRVATYDDSIHYLDFAGIAVVDGELVPLGPDSIPVENWPNAEVLAAAAFDEATQIQRGQDTGSQNVLKEFYSAIFGLDATVEKKIGFTVSELIASYIGLAEFVVKHGNGLFVLTPHEFDMLLGRILRTQDFEKIKRLARYLQYTRNDSSPLPQDSAHFYSPAFRAQVGEYGLVILNDSTIAHARVNCSHDLTYGTHPFILQNQEIQKEYDRLKQQYITMPFEDQIANLFASQNWIVRKNLRGGVLAGKKVVTVIPNDVGEIDIVAVSPTGKTIVVADCKYLFDYGATAKEIASLRDRLTQKYVPQISRKRDWLESNVTPILQAYGVSSCETAKIISMIVTRNRVAFQLESDAILFSAFDLERWLKSQNAI